jgi:hypothetical protein
MVNEIDPDVLLSLLNDPANADLLARLGAYDDQSRNLDKREAVAQHMFATPGAQGRQVGNMYVASSPLEHLGNAVMRGVGASRMKGIESQRNDLVQGNMSASKMLANAMSQAMKARRAQSQIGPEQMATQGAGDLPYDPDSGVA